MRIGPIEQRLLNDYQRGFPLQPRPWASIASDLDTTPDKVLDSLKKLSQQGVVSRVGPVFRPNRVGVSTLAAMAVPEDELEAVAAKVSAFEEVNHNYEREHELNLWFVATAPDQMALDDCLKAIESETGYVIISLPMLKEYHIDLGFRMQLDACSRLHDEAGDVGAADDAPSTPEPPVDEKRDADLIAAIQLGLPLVERPFFEVGRKLGLSEQAVIQRIGAMQAEGVIKRMGVVVRHHELGYRSNAMMVLDVPDDKVEAVGWRLSTVDCVTLCYQRPRRLPQWPYNLFCMIHGKDRADVLACIDDVINELQLAGLQRAVLFSKRRFKQRGAVYRKRS